MVKHKIFPPDWKPQGGEDRGLLADHEGGKPRVEYDKEPTDFKERFKRVMIPEK